MEKVNPGAGAIIDEDDASPPSVGKAVSFASKDSVHEVERYIEIPAPRQYRLSVIEDCLLTRIKRCKTEIAEGRQDLGVVFYSHNPQFSLETLNLILLPAIKFYRNQIPSINVQEHLRGKKINRKDKAGQEYIQYYIWASYSLMRIVLEDPDELFSLPVASFGGIGSNFLTTS